MKFSIKTIPHKKQRYDTCGDYVFKKDEIAITVSDMGSEDYAFLVGVHELIEAYLTYRAGISEESISDFDIEFEENRKEGDDSEPGDDSKAPYRDQHFFATSIERLLAQALGIDWNKYENAVMKL